MFCLPPPPGDGRGDGRGQRGPGAYIPSTRVRLLGARAGRMDDMRPHHLSGAIRACPLARPPTCLPRRRGSPCLSLAPHCAGGCAGRDGAARRARTQWPVSSAVRAVSSGARSAAAGGSVAATAQAQWLQRSVLGARPLAPSPCPHAAPHPVPIMHRRPAPPSREPAFPRPAVVGGRAWRSPPAPRVCLPRARQQAGTSQHNPRNAI